MPLGPLSRLARLAVLPALAGGDREMHDLLVALGVAHLGVAAEITYQDHLVDAAGHCRLPAFSWQGITIWPCLSFIPAVKPCWTYGKADSRRSYQSRSVT